MTQNKTLQAWSLLILLSLIWGSSFILIKKALIVLQPLEVGAIRILSASIFLLPFVLRNARLIQKNQIRYLIYVGLLGSFIPAFLFAIAQTRLESSLTGVLNAMTPIFTIIVGLIVFKQSQKPRVYLGMIGGFTGATILITAGSGGSFSDFNWYGLLVILATLMYAFNLNIIKYKLTGLRAMTITSLSLAIVGPMALVVLLGFTDFTHKIMTVEGAWLATSYTLVLGVVGTALALIIFNRLVSLTDPVFTSSVTYIIPVIAVVWGVWDGEVLQLLHIVGILAILGGVYVANSTRR